MSCQEGSDSEKEEYVDSGLPPPSPYLRRPGSCGIGEPTPGVAKRAMMNRSFGGSLNDVALAMKDLSHLTVADETSDKNGPARVVSKAPAPAVDVFAERKKKLQSAVMTQSMPELRDVRALYNKGIGNELRNRSMKNTPPPTPPSTFDNEIFDSLLTDL
jgi:hypothetical protein